MNSIEKNICEAIDIIVQKAVSEAQYDKTIQATIITCVDTETGKYKIKYQDSIFYAYSNNIETVYPDGTGVYILIPGNDMSKLKTILGTTKKLGMNYIPTVDESDSYEVNGNNCITSSNSFGLCSYRKGSYVKVLYHKEYSESQNLIKLNKVAVEQYIKESGTIICGGIIRTELNQEQQYRGNYGIIFALDFLDNSTGVIVTKYYTIDVDKMVGNPYKLVTDTRQYGIFDINNINFQEVKYISIFTNNFPNTKPDNQLVDDIFISNIELCGAVKLSDDDVNNYNLSILTPQGTYFDDTSLPTDTRSLQAQIRIKGKVIDNTSKNLTFYWFIEHVGIGYQSLYYNKYGGRGWKCLNEYTVIKPAEADQQAVVDWIPATYQLEIKKSDVVAKEARYKCVAIYDQSVMSKIITIKNLSSSYDITIESDSGDQFYFDIGFPTLTCKVNGIEHPEYTYSWAVVDNVGDFQTIAETPDLNQSYQVAYDNYENLLDQIRREAVPEVSNKAKLEQFEQNLRNYDTITRVDKNKIYKLNVNTITIFSTYSCTVYYNDIYLGTASIILKNTLEADGVYSLVINDGSQVYKYNPDGISPASSALESPIEIKALTFSVYNNLGQKIDDEIIRHCEIKWIIPTEDTLLNVPNSYSPSAVDLINNTATYSNLMSFSYLINDRYNIDKKRNNIQLQVTYKSMTLIATTDLTFIKEGESGTNGTDFVCKIVPNTPSGVTPPMYPILTQLSSGSWSLNYSLVSSNRFFRAQLWHNENKILDSVTSTNSSEGKSASITWSILKNKYTSTIYDYTSLSVDAVTGVFSYSGYSYNSPANIVKVTVEYDGVTYYATIPLITVRIANSNYRVTLKDNTGFMYAIYTSDGQDPQYDNVNPFELIVTQNIGSNQWEDITKKTTSQYAVTYSWSYLGQIYNSGWTRSINLADKYGENPAAYQRATKPLDSYDGLCVTNALEAIIYKSGSEIARIHIPIHLYLNRFGHSEINGWDGNSVSIDEQGGVILSPQVGAGIKDSNNRFTGAIMGKVKEAGKTNIEVGLFGYNAGERTFKLSAKDGSAMFGKNNGGQILIDPSQNKALLYSHNFWRSYNDEGLPTSYGTSNQNGAGMLIDLSEPSIKWGNGNFSVDSSGYMVAKGGGKIAGWNLTATELYSGSSYSGRQITLDSSNNKIYSGTKSSNSSTSNGFYLDPNYLVLGSKFKAYSDGRVEIGNGAAANNSSKRWTINADGTNTYIKYGTKGSGGSVYLGTDGFSIGSRFNIDASDSGNVEIKSGSSTILNGTGYSEFYLSKSGIRIGNAFRVDASNSKMEIGRLSGNYKWTINADSYRAYISYGGDTQFYDVNSSYGGSSKVYLGTDGISLGKRFSVDSSGNLKAKNVDISGSLHVNNGGSIANFDILEDRILGRDAGTGRYVVIRNGSTNTQVAFAAGGTDRNTYTKYPFRVTMAGKLYATGATFDGDTTIEGTLSSTTTQSTGYRRKVSITDGQINLYDNNTKVGSLSASTSNVFTLETTGSRTIEISANSILLNTTHLSVERNGVVYGDNGITKTVTVGNKKLQFVNGICIYVG